MISSLDTLPGAALQALWSGVVDTSGFALLVYLTNVRLCPSAATRHKLWWLVVILAVAVPIASFSASMSRVRTISRPHAARTIPEAGGSMTVPRTITIVPNAQPRFEFTVEASTIIATLLALWMGIALVKHVGLFTELLALGRVKRRARPLPETQTALLVAWRANSGERRAAILASSDDVEIPCAAGLRAPAILLPASVVESASYADIDRIAMHEFAHLWRFDDWTNLAGRVIGATLWFNPAIALATRRIAIEREIACDDWVVARTGSAHGYASCLFRLAEASLAGRAPTHALGALGNPRNITSRIEHLLESSNAPRRFARTLPVVLSIVALAVVLGQAMRAPAIAVEASPVTIVSPASVTPLVAPIANEAPLAPVVAPSAEAQATATAPHVTKSAPRPVPLAKPIPKAAPVAAAHAKRMLLIVDAAGQAPLAPLPPLPHLSKITILSEAAPAIPSVPAMPAMPAMPTLPADKIDAAATRLGSAATRLAEDALERVARNEARENRAQRVADEAQERAAERQLRDATRQIADFAKLQAMTQQTDREQIRADVEAARQNEIAREQMSRAHVRAALETVRLGERIRREAIENALQNTREELRREGLTPNSKDGETP